jgi:hypothetical protein
VKFLLHHDVPDDLSYLLEQLGHGVTFLRKALPGDSADSAVLQFAYEHGCVILTCNRDDFLHLANTTVIMPSSLSTAAGPEQKKGLRCFGCSNVLARPVSGTTSTSPDRPWPDQM